MRGIEDEESHYTSERPEGIIPMIHDGQVVLFTFPRRTRNVES